MDLDFFNRIEKENEYKKYLVFHIGHVEEAFHRLIEPLKGKYDKETDDAIIACGVNLTLHDLSKLSKEEFDFYRRHFYPTDAEKKEKEDESLFDKAWEHHHQNNPHHVYYWVHGDEKQEMPLEFIFEMLCDWSSVSQWYDTSLVSWYDKDAKEEKEAFAPNTRKIVDFWVDELFRKPKLKF